MTVAKRPAIWFYASRVEGLVDLYALSHLGTRKAALARAASSKFGVQNMFLYEIAAVVETAVSVQDFGGHDQRGSTHAWIRLVDHLHYDKKLITAEERDAVFAAGHPFDIDGRGLVTFDDRLASDALAKILACKKMDALLYVNKHEHRGSLSLIVVRPELFTIRSMEVLADLPDDDGDILGTIDSVERSELDRRRSGYAPSCL